MSLQRRLNRPRAWLALAFSLGASSGCPVDEVERGIGAAQQRGEWLPDAGFPDVGPRTEPRCQAPHPCESGIEVPADQHYAAPGLCVRAVALQQDELRQITFAPNGDLFGVTTSGEIRRYRDTNCDGTYASTPPERVLWASTGGNGNNVHIDSAAGYLYAGIPHGVMRWRYDPASDHGVDPQYVVLGHPSFGEHTYVTVHVYDGFLYAHSGSQNNVSGPVTPPYDIRRALLKRFELASFDPEAPFEWVEDGEPHSLGLRNVIGFTQHPNGDLFGVVGGIDDVQYAGQDVDELNPADTVVRLAQGAAFGYPHCFHSLQVARPDGGMFPIGTPLHTELGPQDGFPTFANEYDDAWCAANTDPPVTLLAPHSEPLDIAFLTRRSDALPQRWVGGAFVTLHGSENGDQSTGHKVVWVPFTEDGSAAEQPRMTAHGLEMPYEVVFGGGAPDATREEGRAPVDGGWRWLDDDGNGEDLVRPVGVAVSPVDGALYVSSDNARTPRTDGSGISQGALYRIAYR